MSKQHSTAAAIDTAFGTKTPLDPGHIRLGTKLPSCHSGVDGPLTAAESKPGCPARILPMAVRLRHLDLCLLLYEILNTPLQLALIPFDFYCDLLFVTLSAIHPVDSIH